MGSGVPVVTDEGSVSTSVCGADEARSVEFAAGSVSLSEDSGDAALETSSGPALDDGLGFVIVSSVPTVEEGDDVAVGDVADDGADDDCGAAVVVFDVGAGATLVAGELAVVEVAVVELPSVAGVSLGFSAPQLGRAVRRSTNSRHLVVAR